jgi:hypothetical protein
MYLIFRYNGNRNGKEPRSVKKMIVSSVFSAVSSAEHKYLCKQDHTLQ